VATVRHLRLPCRSHEYDDDIVFSSLTVFSSSSSSSQFVRHSYSHAHILSPDLFVFILMSYPFLILNVILELMAQELGLTVDLVGYAEARKVATELSKGEKSATSAQVDLDVHGISHLRDSHVPATLDEYDVLLFACLFSFTISILFCAT
jgi:hypothetical protein